MRAKELAAAHWAYVEELLKTHGVGEYTIGVVGWHYRRAMEHGYGHGYEDAQNHHAQAESICKTASAYYDVRAHQGRTTTTLAVES